MEKHDGGALATPVHLTERSAAKAQRREAMLSAAAELFAEHGYNGVSIEDLGAASGVSGPAVYRHFAGKQAVLGALLVDVSLGLLDGALTVVSRGLDASETLRELVRFQVAFALDNAAVIRVQDRDLNALSESDVKRVKSLQRAYVDVWVDALVQLFPGTERGQLRQRAQAVFGLINSTPHTLHRRQRGSESAAGRQLGEMLTSMAFAALTVLTS